MHFAACTTTRGHAYYMNQETSFTRFTTAVLITQLNYLHYNNV